MTDLLNGQRLWTPYFVYGTLRPHYGNSDLWQRFGATAHHDGDAYVEGFQMFGYGIPYAIRSDNPEHRVYGAVIKPHGDEAWTIRYNLDSLEGYPDGYDRQIVTAHTPDGEIECWIYTPTRWQPGGEPEPSGDYDNMILAIRKERFRV